MQITRRPNFFILGAPKCATTSMSVWLRGHPDIFMPAKKEPHFFNTDDRQGITGLKQYEQLFSSARPRHHAIGEASVWYLSSATAVDNILRYQPDARFMVMVRNPLEMAPALHAQMVISGHENVRDFAAAWMLQEDRRYGRKLPSFGWSRRRLQYGEVCSLGAQLERLLARVSAERVAVTVLDDLCADARKEYLCILKFLGVADDGRTGFPIHNDARASLLPGFNRVLNLLGEAKYQLGMRHGLGMLESIENINQIRKQRKPVPPELRRQMASYFAADIKVLEGLLDRDFRHWLV